MKLQLRPWVTLIAMLLWFCGSETMVCAQSEATKAQAIGSLEGYPFILVTDETPADIDLVISDAEFNRIATGVQFVVNRTKVDTESEFFQMYREEVLPLLRREKLYPVKLFIRGAASPEGSYDNNRRLGIGRSQNLLKILTESLHSDGLAPDMVEAKVVTEDYSYLVSLMQEANDPDAAAVQALMDSCQWDELTCKVALQQMRGGSVWQRLAHDYFPQLRSARIVLWLSRQPHSANSRQSADSRQQMGDAYRSTGSEEHRSYAGRRDTIHVRDTIYISQTHDIIKECQCQGTTIIYVNNGRGGLMNFTSEDSIPRHPLFAIKTNLLFDVVTAINASIEVPLGSRYSASAEVVWPWWVDTNNKWCLQMGNVGLEGRYYFKPWQRHSSYCDWRIQDNTPLQGGFVGLHADATYYDFGWDYAGHQGEAWSAGVTLGYQRRLSRQFNLEFSIGLGGAKHQYRKYDVSDDAKHVHLWRGETIKDQWYFGPTKAKISLVWLLYKRCGNKCQKGDEL